METVEDDVLPSWDDANEGDVIAVFMNFSDYVINTNMEMQVVKWTDHDNNKIKNKCLMVVDGKVADEIPKSVICGKLSSGTQACQHGGT